VPKPVKFRSHRSWSQQRQICRAILSASPDDPELRNKLRHEHRLSDDELVVFHGIARHTLDFSIKKHSIFKHYYRSQIKKPFLPVIAAVIIIVVVCVTGVYFLFSKIDWTEKTYPLITSAAALVAVSVAAIGWGFGAWVSYRNSQIQHTVNTVFTRFAQTPFSENLRKFHRKFGYEIDPPITYADVKRLEKSGDDDQDAAQAMKFLLNYYEFMSVGILRGDLDFGIIEKTLRGNMLFIFNKTLPFIAEIRKSNQTTLEHFVEMVDHLREV
jgi:hypothetical protein